MPSTNKKQLNFFLLVKAYKEYGEMGVYRQYKYLEGYKPKLTDEYMNKIIKTAGSINPADLIDMTSGIKTENPLGDKKELKAGYWALFRGKYKPRNSNDEVPKEGEFIAMIKRVDNQKGVVNFYPHNFKNKFGQTMEIPKRANISHPEHMYLDYALFDNVIRTGKTPQEVAREKENLEEVRKIIRKILKENLTSSEEKIKKAAEFYKEKDFISDIFDNINYSNLRF